MHSTDHYLAGVVAQVVPDRTRNREVLSLITAGLFSLLLSFLSFNQRFILNQVLRGGATLLVFSFPRKNADFAVLLEVKQA